MFRNALAKNYSATSQPWNCHHVRQSKKVAADFSFDILFYFSNLFLKVSCSLDATTDVFIASIRLRIGPGHRVRYFKFNGPGQQHRASKDIQRAARCIDR